MNKSKTLIIVTPGFPADEDDTTCIPPRQVFVKALQKTDPTLQLIVLTVRYPFFSGTYKWNGVEVISFGDKNANKAKRLLAYFKLLRTLRRLKKQTNIIGLLSFWLDKTAVVASYFAQRNNLPHYCWILGQDAKKDNKYVQWMKPKGAELLALSDFIAREFQQNYGITPENVIPVGIDPQCFDQQGLERSIDVLGVGSLIPLKQFDVFVAVIKALSLVFPKIKVVICGDGLEMENLNKMKIELGLRAHLTLTGSLAHAEVLKLMQQSKLLLHTANYEGFGTVQLEALCAGAQVISFVKPMDMMIENWHHVDGMEEMINCAKQILANPSPIYQRVIPFEITEIAAKVLDLYAHQIDPMA